ncbi:unnamed protein product [Polarella glacialis]|nr:unnamed protein product [Polarella glacialis]
MRAAGPDSSSFLRRVWRATISAEQDNLGVGLALFYNTQLFLICFCFLILMASVTIRIHEAQGSNTLFSGGDEHGGCSMSGARMEEMLAFVVAGQTRYAVMSQYVCMVLWPASVLLSWAFHWYQKQSVRKYDNEHQTAEDYTVMLTDLPKDMMSERRLKEVLEKELVCLHGEIHGVSICYDMKHISTESQERLESMLERIVEWDDLRNEWCPGHLGTPEDELAASMEEDARIFEEMLQNELRGSGRAYVVFKMQQSLVKVLKERRGILQSAFQAQTDEKEASPMKSTAHSPIFDVVKLVHTNDAPEGLLYNRMWMTPQEESATNHEMPRRLFLYVAAYGVVAQLFYSSMILPYQDNFVEGGEDAAAVKIVGKVVLLFNVAIQTAVMIEVADCGFVRVIRIDQVTFIWNTILLLLSIGYGIFQQCWRAGMRFVLVAPELADEQAWWEWRRLTFQSVQTESMVGANLAGVLTEQILMLYILGEVGNVLAPVLFNWAALRAIFVINIGGSHDSFAQRTLRRMLPKFQSPETVTPREAERAQILAPFLLWMEYSYVVVFPSMALCTFYIASDKNLNICAWLFGFSLIFYMWQRYVMLWLYGKTSYDSDDTYKVFIVMWGVVLSQIPSAAAWWSYRVGEITEAPFAFILMAMTFSLSLLIYEAGLLFIDSCFWENDIEMDDMDEDPGYVAVMDQTGASWWNVNPIYVLKQRYCPDLPGFELHGRDVQCWPSYVASKGFFEIGKEFRHRAKNFDTEQKSA